MPLRERQEMEEMSRAAGIDFSRSLHASNGTLPKRVVALSG
jgi:hypothetical protein